MIRDSPRAHDRHAYTGESAAGNWSLS
jgi:hypothetical protein